MTDKDLGPFSIRPQEWEILQPLVGTTILELGNKKNRLGTYKDFFTARGYQHTSVDINGRDGSIKRDLRKPLDLGTFDMVTNIGTSEHVAAQEPCWRNILEAMHVGTVLVCVTPLPGSQHGIWHPTREFYPELARLNGLAIDRLTVAGNRTIQCQYARMTRTQAAPFTMPGLPLLGRNDQAHDDGTWKNRAIVVADGIPL